MGNFHNKYDKSLSEASKTLNEAEPQQRKATWGGVASKFIGQPLKKAAIGGAQTALGLNNPQQWVKNIYNGNNFTVINREFLNAKRVNDEGEVEQLTKKFRYQLKGFLNAIQKIYGNKINIDRYFPANMNEGISEGIFDTIRGIPSASKIEVRLKEILNLPIYKYIISSRGKKYDDLIEQYFKLPTHMQRKILELVGIKL